jgi:hypothetical protein
LGCPLSRQTLLRLIHRLSLAGDRTPRVLGVDEVEVFTAPQANLWSLVCTEVLIHADPAHTAIAFVGGASNQTIKLSAGATWSAWVEGRRPSLGRYAPLEPGWPPQR